MQQRRTCESLWKSWPKEVLGGTEREVKSEGDDEAAADNKFQFVEGDERVSKKVCDKADEKGEQEDLGRTAAKDAGKIECINLKEFKNQDKVDERGSLHHCVSMFSSYLYYLNWVSRHYLSLKNKICVKKNTRIHHISFLQRIFSYLIILWICIYL